MAHRTVGRYRGHPYALCRMSEALPLSSGRWDPSRWFAWTPDRSDLVVAGVRTRKAMERHIDTEIHEAEVMAAVNGGTS
jgi:hypothetical protein